MQRGTPIEGERTGLCGAVIDLEHGNAARRSRMQAAPICFSDYGIQGPDEGTGLALLFGSGPGQEERLTASRNYWVTSLWPDGRPHSMPVWGVWDGEALWFSSGRRSRKARNLASDPRCVVSTENADEPVVIEGSAEIERRAGRDRARCRSDERQVRRHNGRVPGGARHGPGAAALGLWDRPRRLHRITHPLGLRLALGRIPAQRSQNGVVQDLVLARVRGVVVGLLDQQERRLRYLVRGPPRPVEEIGIPGTDEDQALGLPCPQVLRDRALIPRRAPRRSQRRGVVVEVPGPHGVRKPEVPERLERLDERLDAVRSSPSPAPR